MYVNDIKGLAVFLFAFVFIFSITEPCYEFQAGFELVIPLPWPPGYRD